MITINENYISIPPYLSTKWNFIDAIHMDGSLLVISLADGSVVEIPDLSLDVIEQVFSAHAKSLEKSDEAKQQTLSKNTLGALGGDIPLLKFGISGGESFGAMMQHSIENSHAPDLPKEILEKVVTVAKIVAADSGMEVPKAEPHCNCPHCQIARAINSGLENSEEAVEQEEVPEVVKDEDLTFSQWIIEEAGDKLYDVINKLDASEKYTVHIGTPVGCTCGEEGCEHLIAVLKEPLQEKNENS